MLLAHQAVGAAFKAQLQDRDPDACSAMLDQFHETTAIALLCSDWSCLLMLAAHKRGALKTADALFESDPRRFRSGPAKHALIRHVNGAPLSPHAAQARPLNGHAR